MTIPDLPTRMDSFDRYVELGPGRRVHVEAEGRGSDVLFFPGNGCTIADAVPLRDAIVRRYRFVGIDPPGRPPTTWPDEPFHFIRDLLPIVDHVADDVGVTARPHVVIGHSMGAMLALQYANRHRNTVRGLVLIEGFPTLDIHFRVVSHEGFRCVRMLETIRAAWERRRAECTAWEQEHPQFHASFWPSQREHDARPFVAELGVPILVIVGGLGQAMPPLSDLDAWRKHLGMDRVGDLTVHVVSNAGHWTMLDDPPAVEVVVMPFIERCMRRVAFSNESRP